MEEEIYNLCGCGCGGVPSPGRKFLPGHHARLPEHKRKPNPEKYVERECPYCGKVFSCYKSSSQVYCCPEHYYESMTDKTYEEIHGPERAEEIKENKKGQVPWNKGLTKEEDSRLQPRGCFKGVEEAWNKGLTKETDERVAKYSVPRSLEVREQIAEASSQRIMERGSNHKFYKNGQLVLDRLGITVWYRSSYEKEALFLLDSYSDVIEVSVESIRIKYFWEDGSTHYYTPDLLVTVQDGKNYIIEVKPKGFLDDPINVLKIQAGREYAKKHNMTFLIWTEDFLFNKNGVTTTFLQVTGENTAAIPDGMMI